MQSCFLKKHKIGLIRSLILVLYSVLFTILTEFVVRNSFVDALRFSVKHFNSLFFTSLFLFLIMFFIYMLTKRIDFPIFIVGIITFIFAIANFFKISYRSEPVYPWDLGLLSEVKGIASRIKFSITAPMIIFLIFILASFAFFLYLHIKSIKTKKIQKFKLNKKLIGAYSLKSVISLVVLVCYTVFVMSSTSVMKFFNIKESPFRQLSASRRNGAIQSFVMNTKYLIPEKPENYNEETVINSANSIYKHRSQKIKPNIIFLMNESYADISLCKNVTFHDDIFNCTEFIKQHFVSGTLMGEQYGGGTCNSEFETLTGFSMANLPTGCTPYQQYFNKETVSYPRFLKGLGYNTVAIHAYGKHFWNRDVAYPNMGFDKFISEEDFVSPERRRGLIKDDELVKMIIKEYEANKSTGKPFFNFSVSMQNHGSYKNGQYLENYRTHLTCDELNDEQEGILTTYATGIRDANIALDKLLSYFSDIKEPTIICMFGDHLGSLGGSDEIYIKSGYLNGDPEKNVNDMAKKQSTPFFLWDNFTSHNFIAPKMSFYQLIPSICDWYNLERPLYFDYLIDQQKHLRGAALGMYLDIDGNPSYELKKDAEPWLKNHKLFQYDLMFGKKYSQEKIYTAN